MVKLFFVLRKKPEMSAEDFHRHWRDVHAPLVARLPGLIRYCQHHVVSVSRPGYANEDAPIDGVVETWWESPEAVQHVENSPEFEAVRADELKFVAHSNHHVHALRVTESFEVVNRS